MYKVVFIDLDGTLLDSDKSISEDNRRAISDAMNRGIKIVISTGKVFKAARKFADAVGVGEEIITCNGSEIRNVSDGKLLYSNLLSNEESFRIIDICRSEDIYFHAYILDEMYTERYECPNKFYWKENVEVPVPYKIRINIVPDLKEIINSSKIGISKFLLVSQDMTKIGRVRKMIESNISSVDVMSSCDDNLEVVRRGVNKGVAVKFLSDIYKFERQEIIAIGDSENDYSMLECAGLKVAMGNGKEVVKLIADIITDPCDENSIAKILDNI